MLAARDAPAALGFGGCRRMRRKRGDVSHTVARQPCPQRPPRPTHVMRTTEGQQANAAAGGSGESVRLNPSGRRESVVQRSSTQEIGCLLLSHSFVNGGYQ